MQGMVFVKAICYADELIEYTPVFVSKDPFSYK